MRYQQTPQEQIQELEVRIQTQEQLMMQLEMEVAELNAELVDFEIEYNTIVKPISDQIDAVKGAIKTLEDLELKQMMGDMTPLESLWKNARRHNRPQQDPPPFDGEFASNKLDNDDPDLKALYRRLARKYHPDLAQDDDDREKRTRLMALINNAYLEGDILALQELEEGKDINNISLHENDANIPLEILRLRRLQMKSYDLHIKLEALKIERSELRYGTLMSLKLDASAARAKGENLLQDIAQNLEQEYWQLVKKLNKLRENVQ